MRRIIEGLKYAKSEISDNYNDPFWRKRRIDRRINSPIQRRINPISESTYITEESWDTLIIADAMRSDLYFDQLSDDYDEIFDRETTVKSPGSSTTAWLKETFGDSHGDIVYIAGNPMVSRFKRDSFHKIYEVWDEAFDEETSIIDPKAVTEKALEARKAYPNKRLIVHYMQPHYPFIGYPELNYAEYDFDDLGLNKDRELRSGINSVWQALASDIVEKDDVWEGYISNAKTVFKEIEKICNQIDDKRVVTSDHGNMIGERSWPIPIRSYGHPDYMRNEELIEVPWLIIDGNKRDITSGKTNSPEKFDTEKASDRLSALGYKE
jgi:hypothetical protein